MNIRERLSVIWQKCRPIVVALASGFYTEIYLPMCERPGIYLLTGTRGSRYVGSSVVSMRRRWREHESALRRNVHHNTPFQDAYNSGEGFVGVLLEPLPADCPMWFVEERERFWIAAYGDSVLNIPNSAHRATRH
jgi:hypothetical protein